MGFDNRGYYQRTQVIWNIHIVPQSHASCDVWCTHYYSPYYYLRPPPIRWLCNAQTFTFANISRATKKKTPHAEWFPAFASRTFLPRTHLSVNLLRARLLASRIWTRDDDRNMHGRTCWRQLKVCDFIFEITLHSDNIARRWVNMCVWVGCVGALETPP